MPNNPLVSVIIPVYNGEAFLSETLESVLSQDYPAIEVIVIDDGSSDGSAAILKGFATQLTLIKQPNKGVAASRNTGMAAANGRYLAFIDQDDLWLPEKTRLQVQLLEAHPEIDYVLSRQHFFLQQGTQRPSWFKPDLLRGDHTGYVPGAFLGRKAVFEKVGGFDTHYRSGGDDMAWFFKAKDMQIPMMHMPEPLLLKRVHGGNASGNVKAIHKEFLHIVRQSISRQQVVR